MEIELTAEAKDRRLNRLVAITVVVLSVFTAVCNIKDGNLVQAMQQAKADSVDTWGEYQATRTKLHVAENTREEIAVIGADVGVAGRLRVGQVAAALDAEIAKYRREAPKLAAKAKGFSDQYDGLNVHDDQFDASEGLISSGASLAWQVGANTQLDVGGTLGLNSASPDAALHLGVAHRF